MVWGNIRGCVSVRLVYLFAAMAVIKGFSSIRVMCTGRVISVYNESEIIKELIMGNIIFHVGKQYTFIKGIWKIPITLKYRPFQIVCVSNIQFQNYLRFTYTWTFLVT